MYRNSNFRLSRIEGVRDVTSFEQCKQTCTDYAYCANQQYTFNEGESASDAKLTCIEKFERCDGFRYTDNNCTLYGSEPKMTREEYEDELSQGSKIAFYDGRPYHHEQGITEPFETLSNKTAHECRLVSKNRVGNLLENSRTVFDPATGACERYNNTDTSPLFVKRTSE